MVLNLPQGHEDSEYELSFEIGQREGGFYTARTDTQTGGQTQPVPYQYIDTLRSTQFSFIGAASYYVISVSRIDSFIQHFD